MFVYIGRQAIYNSDFVVAGYELLYRNGANRRAAQILDDDAATRSVLSDAFTVFGIQNLTNRLPAYINFTRNLLLDNFVYLADPKDVVVDIPGDIDVDDRLIDKLSEIQASGYKLSLGGYNQVNGVLRFNRILHIFDVIRVNIRKNNRLQIRELMNRVRQRNVRLLAEQVETAEDFDTARALNFTLFQGYFFEKPMCLSKEIPLAASSYGKLLNEVARQTINFERCCDIIRADAVLTHLFLHEAPAARVYHFRNSAPEITRALMEMGTEGLRRWACVVMLKQMNITPSDELPKRAFQRGLFIEKLVENSTSNLYPGQGFLAGVFSLMDQVMGLQLVDLLRDLNIYPDLKLALLGKKENEYTHFLQYVVIYEMANERLILPDVGLKISPEEVSRLYMDCTEETDRAFERFGTEQSAVPAYRGNILR